MSFDMLDPSPGNGYRTFAVGHADDQQLMPGTNLGALHDQTDLAQVTELCCQPLPGDRFIPIPNSDGSVFQETFQTLDGAQEFGFAGYFASDPAQGHRAALVDPDQQPDKVADLGDPLPWAQFQNSLNPGMILAVDRHGSPPNEVFWQINFTWSPPADQLFFVKVPFSDTATHQYGSLLQSVR